MKQYTIREYMGFTRNGPLRAGMISLPEHAFDQLEQFILSNREERSGTQPLELMSLSAKPSVGKVITAKNYVGVITTREQRSRSYPNWRWRETTATRLFAKCFSPCCERFRRLRSRHFVPPT